MTCLTFPPSWSCDLKQAGRPLERVWFYNGNFTKKFLPRKLKVCSCFTLNIMYKSTLVLIWKKYQISSSAFGTFQNMCIVMHFEHQYFKLIAIQMLVVIYCIYYIYLFLQPSISNFFSLTYVLNYFRFRFLHKKIHAIIVNARSATVSDCACAML